MAFMTQIDRTFMIRILGTALLLGAGSAQGAPGTLADSPLFLTTTVQPNIMFLADDSGSMDSEVLRSDGVLQNDDVDFTPDDDAERLELCAGYNVLAYNPNTTYTAWAGKDSAGNPFPASMPLTAARDNPYDPSSTSDLSTHFFFTWTDNGDGVYQDGECSISPASNATDCAATPASCVRVATLPAAQQTNYANWYSYYRKREYVAKRAMSEVISKSSARVGLVTLNNNNSVTTPIADIDDITTPIDTTAQTNKATLLDNVAQIDSDHGTALRRKLKDVGDYFDDDDGSDGNIGPNPLLPSSQGGECQQNFTIVMTDGYWNDVIDSNDPSDTYVVGNQDDGAAPWAGGSFADTYSDTLADIAMKYYKEDLSSALADNVPVTTADPQNLSPDRMHQHLVTFTAAFGLDGTLNANPTDQTTAFSWPEPVANTATTIDDLRHAAWNGRGEFLSAGDPASLINGLDAALAAISGRTSTGASVAFNTSALSTNSEVYLALFNSSRWTGDLLSYSLDPLTGVVSSTPSWSAGWNLSSRDLSTYPRVIYTWDGSDGTAFQWGNLTTNQQDDLRTNSTGGTDSEATGLARLHYIRGDRVCEQNYTGTGAGVGASSVSSCSYTEGTSGTSFSAASFRSRDSRLGDIVHSTPVYVGKPGSGWPDELPGTTPYSNFKLDQDGRVGTIYVGANDGMLHGFSETSGIEIMSYIPDAIFSTAGGSGLHTLTDPNYSHKYYVDLTPTVVDAFVSTTTSNSATWRTLLVGGLRGGGRGLYALDVTSPVNSESGTTPADKVLWEFTGADDADLGYTFSRPSIVLMPNGEWAAIFGNGYNDSGSGEAALFILYIEEGIDGTWSAGDYVKISTGVGDTTNRNGLATPAVIDINGDNIADRVYAGDLRGNMWVFDLSSTNPNNWDSAYSAGSSPSPLFTAPANQAITARPEIVRNPDEATSNSTYPNLLVLFGTGQYIVPTDNTTTFQQAFYGIWDSGSDGLTTADLIHQDISTGATSGGITVRTLSAKPVDYAGGDDGWYMNLPDSGERSVSNALVRGDNVFFNTAIPDTDPCSLGGSGWKMVADFSTGGAPAKAAFDVNNDGRVTTLDEVDGVGAAGERTFGIPSEPVNLGDMNYTSTTETTDGDSIDQTVLEKLNESRTGRLSWEELVRD
jgi:type IV pilus assembly protein PilY1